MVGHRSSETNFISHLANTIKVQIISSAKCMNTLKKNQFIRLDKFLNFKKLFYFFLTCLNSNRILIKVESV